MIISHLLLICCCNFFVCRLVFDKGPAKYCKANSNKFQLNTRLTFSFCIFFESKTNRVVKALQILRQRALFEVLKCICSLHFPELCRIVVLSFSSSVLTCFLKSTKSDDVNKENFPSKFSLPCFVPN